MQKRFNLKLLIPVVLIAGILLYFVPPVNTRLAPRLDALRTQIKYFINPPEDATFQPSGQTAATPTHTNGTPTLAPTQTPKPESTPTAGPTLTPTITSTPLPATVKLTEFRYEDQKNRWNYCGPANLSMALNFVGWDGNRDVVAKVIKPGVADPKLDFIQQGKSDYNVMPYEMVDFVNEQTEFKALSRLGGDISLAKRLLAAGFPFIAEKGYYEKDYSGKVAWLGHYQFVTGYDDAKGVLIVQDTWNDGPNFPIPYDEFESPEAWLSFNDLFIIVYQPEREAELLAVLGPYADETWAARHALENAEALIKSSTGLDAYFDWFAKGTSHVALFEYVDAATAFDQAFAIYNDLGKDDKQRPYRMMWYQTGPYFAYFYAGRYQDVVTLADVTLTIKPTLEESILWRGRAKYMLGDTPGAVADFREALRLHPKWGPAVQALQDLGLQP
jgi:tetratricopeptide (TPR) repeat protein